MALLSRRSRFELTTNAIARAHEAAIARGATLLSLTESNPTNAGLSLSAAQLARAFASPALSEYAAAPFGRVATREALCAALARCGVEVAPAELMLTASTSEAYGLLLKLLCDPGDAVLVPTPSYPLFDVLAQLEGVRLVPYPLRYDGEWHVDGEALRHARALGVRAVLLVHPNNPTGHYLKRDELALLRELALPVISDEVFAEYALGADPERVPSALALRDTQLVFRLGGLSKSLALPQLKLAWTVIGGPSELRAEATARLEHMADAYLSPSSAVQLAVPALLGHAPEVQERILARVRTNLAELTRVLSVGSPASVLKVEGGWYAIVRLPEVMDEESWVLTLMERDGVLVQPGYFYDFACGAHIVLSLITQENVFAEGVRRIVARVLSC